MVSWTLEKEVLLVDFVREQRCLWDPKDENYYRREDRNAILDELADLLGEDERGIEYTRADIKEKFHSMRTIFNREAKKVETSLQSEGGLGAVYMPRWIHYNRMQFLRDVFRARSSHDHLVITCVEEECKQEPEDGDVPSTSDFNHFTTPVAPPPRHRKRKANTDEIDTTKMDLYTSILKCLQQPAVVDPNDTFGKYVADTLKSMGFWNRERCKAEIQQVMMKHLLSDVGNEA